MASNGRVNGQLALPGLSLKVRGKGRRGPELSTLKLPAVSTARFECDVDDELQVTISGPDGEVLLGYYVRCDAVSFKKHRPPKGHPWLERIQALSLIGSSVELDDVGPGGGDEL